MKSDTARSHERAVGSQTHDSWLEIGQMQFDYLVKHGLQPGDRMLEIGCGNLRAGRLFIDYLDPGNYYGIDISPDILLAATHQRQRRYFTLIHGGPESALWRSTDAGKTWNKISGGFPV